MTGVHVLYRFYNATGQLLYVGITMDPPTRFRGHAEAKEWWAQVSGITVENYQSRNELAAAERRAIQVERPLHNIIHNGVRKLHRIPRANAGSLVFRCERCNQPVTGDTGYLHVSYDDIYAHEQAWNKWEQKQRTVNADDEPVGGYSIYRWIPATALADLAGPARWRVHHRKCDPDPDGNDYWVSVNRVTSYEELLSWTAHLLNKTWLSDTDWSDFIRKCLKEAA